MLTISVFDSITVTESAPLRIMSTIIHYEANQLPQSASPAWQDWGTSGGWTLEEISSGNFHQYYNNGTSAYVWRDFGRDAYVDPNDFDHLMWASGFSVEVRIKFPNIPADAYSNFPHFHDDLDFHYNIYLYGNTVFLVDDINEYSAGSLDLSQYHIFRIEANLSGDNVVNHYVDNVLIGSTQLDPTGLPSNPQGNIYEDLYLENSSLNFGVVDSYLDYIRIDTSRLLFVSVNDTVSVVDNIQAGYDLTWNDYVTVSEYFAVLIPGPVLFISVFQNVTVTDSPAVVIPTLFIKKNDYIHAVDSVLNQPEQLGGNVEVLYGGTASSGGEWAQKIAQSFVALSNSIAFVQFQCAKAGTPTDNVLVDIVSTLDGASLGNVTVAATSIITGINTFTFSSPVSVVNGNTYYIQVSRSGARDTTNVVDFLRNLSVSSGGGNAYVDGREKRRDDLVWGDTSSPGNEVDLTFFIGFSGIQTVDVVSSPSVVDSVTVTDVPTINIPIVYISVFDLVTIGETVGDLVAYTISVSDFISVGEGIIVFLPSLSVSVSQTISVDEAVSNLVADNTSVADAISVIENVSFDLIVPAPLIQDQRPEGHIIVETFGGEVRGG